MKFSDLGVTTDVVVGKGIEMDELFGQHILIEKTIIKPTNFPGEKFKRFAYANASMFPNLVAGRVLGKRRRRKSERAKTILFYRIRRSNWCYTGSRTTYSNHQQRS